MDSLEKELPEVPLPPPSMPQLPSPPRDRAADGEDAHPAPVPGQASSGGENGSKLDQVEATMKLPTPCRSQSTPTEMPQLPCTGHGKASKEGGGNSGFKCMPVEHLTLYINLI